MTSLPIELYVSRVAESGFFISTLAPLFACKSDAHHKFPEIFGTADPDCIRFYSKKQLVYVLISELIVKCKFQLVRVFAQIIERFDTSGEPLKEEP